MLASLAVQYALFLVLCATTLSHTPAAPNIEDHLFNSAVTLLFATAYLTTAWLLRELYRLIAHKRSHLNPDVDLVYDQVGDSLRDLDPEFDEDPAPPVHTAPPRSKSHGPLEICDRCVEDTPHACREDVPAGSAHDLPQATSAPPVFPAAFLPDPSRPRHPRYACSETDSTQPSRLSYPSESIFFREVYGYGVVIFVVYYSVDMVLLSPALSILCGLMALSVRDALTLVRSPPTAPEQIVASKFVTFTAMLLLFIAIVEMFVANSFADAPREDPLGETMTPVYLLLCYALPCLACLLLGGLDRTCADLVKIRRAAPLAVIISVFIICWVLGVDVVTGERDIYRDALQQAGEAWDSWYAGNADTIAADADTIAADAATDDARPVDYSGPAEYTGPLDHLDDAALADPAATRNLPLVVIIVEPILKLTLTFSVITGVVNRKATDTAAIICLLTAAKQIHITDSAYAMDHLVRSCVISGTAALLCAARYLPCLHRLLRPAV